MAKILISPSKYLQGAGEMKNIGTYAAKCGKISKEAIAEILEIKDLCFAYPEEEKRALNHISFQIKEGEFLVLCGKSGCGKSTVGTVIMRLQDPTDRKSVV